MYIQDVVFYGDDDDWVEGYDLDVGVQAQVGRWFPEAADEIRDRWVLLDQQLVKSPLPSQLVEGTVAGKLEWG